MAKLILRNLRREWIRVALGTAAVALIAVHGAVPTGFRVDTTSLGLLVFVLVILLLPQIEELDLFGNKIKFRKEVEETNRQASQVDARTRTLTGADAPEFRVSRRPTDEKLANTDPISAVAADRLDLSKLYSPSTTRFTGLTPKA
jgi:hypothetical protein